MYFEICILNEMKKTVLIFGVIFIIITLHCGCISNNDNSKTKTINAEYIVKITTNVSVNYEVICPITLSLTKDPLSYNNDLEIIDGSGSFQIKKIASQHFLYENLSSTERGEMNLYGLEIKSNNSIVIQYKIHTKEILPMSLRWKEYWIFFNSSLDSMHKINIDAYSEPSGGNSYESDIHVLKNGWDTIKVEVGGWDP